MKDHRQIDERSLAFDLLIAAKLREDPSVVEKARGNLERWMQSCSPGLRPALLEWREILNGSPDELLRFLAATDERAARLRQSSPFAGVLTQEERLGIVREFQARESAPA